MILSNFKAALENGLRKAHRSVGKPFGIFEEKPKRTCKRPPYKKLWEAERQRSDALLESLHALQRELAQKEAENGTED
jgi:hypothetical protein